MIALPPKAEVHPPSCYVAEVPRNDICTAANRTTIRSPSSARARSVVGDPVKLNIALQDIALHA